MRRWAEFVLRHRKAVVAFWGIVLIAGILLSKKTSDRLTVDFSLPGQPGTETAQKIKQAFGNGGDTNPYLVTVTLPQGQTVAGHEADTARAFTAIGTALPTVRVVDEANTGDNAFRTKDGRTAYALVFYRFNPSPSQQLLTKPIRQAAATAAPAGATASPARTCWPPAATTATARECSARRSSARSARLRCSPSSSARSSRCCPWWLLRCRSSRRS